VYKLQKSIILTERLISESQSVKLPQFLLLITKFLLFLLFPF